MRITITLLALFLAAPVTAHGRSAKAARVREMARITDNCHLARASLREDRSGVIHIRPSPTAKYENVDCMLTELRKSSLVGKMPMGFVGNEAIAPEVKKN